MESLTGRSAWSEKWAYLKSHGAFRAAPVTTMFRLLCWRVRCWIGLPVTVPLPAWSLSLRVPPQWRGAAKILYVFREDYERELACLRQLLSPGAVVVDVGASVGIYALVAARLAGEGGAVLAFEPTAESFTFLEQNVHMNHLRNVRTLPIALSSRSGQARIYHHADSSRNSLGRADSAGADSEEVRTEPLDLILEQEGIRRLDFLKMDVEGAEELVLLGADDILRRARPAILFEVNPVAANHLGLRGDGAWRLLENRGYLFYEATSNGRLQSLHSPPEGGNVIAIHQDRSGLPTSL